MARGLKSVRNHATEYEASTNHDEKSPPQTQQAPPTPAIHPIPPYLCSSYPAFPGGATLG